jgi:hypothetical protein
LLSPQLEANSLIPYGDFAPLRSELSRRLKIAELIDCQKDSEGIQPDINVSFNGRFHLMLGLTYWKRHQSF